MNIDRCDEIISNKSKMQGASSTVSYSLELINKEWWVKLKKYAVLGIDGVDEMTKDDEVMKDIGNKATKLMLNDRINLYEELVRELTDMELSMKLEECIITPLVRLRIRTKEPTDRRVSMNVGLSILNTISKSEKSESFKLYSEISNINIKYKDGRIYVSRIWYDEIELIVLKLLYLGMRDVSRASRKRIIIKRIANEVLGANTNQLDVIADKVISDKCNSIIGLKVIRDKYNRLECRCRYGEDSVRKR